MRQFCEFRFRPTDLGTDDPNVADYLAGYAEALADGPNDRGAATEDVN